ncbi:MAG: hypothetical protein ACYS91_05825 [Planctomycetota bacterium]|jgi:hypothetical protein
MQKEKKEKLLICLDIIILIIITLGLGFFAFSFEKFRDVLGRFLICVIEGYVCQIIPPWLAFILVLGFDISWIVLMVKWKGLKNIYVKIFITWLVIVMSALVLYVLAVLVILYSIGTIS